MIWWTPSVHPGMYPFSDVFFWGNPHITYVKLGFFQFLFVVVEIKLHFAFICFVTGFKWYRPIGGTLCIVILLCQFVEKSTYTKDWLRHIHTLSPPIFNFTSHDTGLFLLFCGVQFNSFLPPGLKTYSSNSLIILMDNTILTNDLALAKAPETLILDTGISDHSLICHLFLQITPGPLSNLSPLITT